MLFAFFNRCFFFTQALIMNLNWSSIQTTAVRLQPGEDLKSEVSRIACDHQLQAACVISAVGSLSEVSLRLANRAETTTFEGKHEIISLSGTLSKNGIHLHMSVANSDGQVFGGHVMEGSVIHTTLEIVIAELKELVFTREPCSIFGYKELIVNARSEGD